MKKVKQYLDYATTYTKTIIAYQARYMNLTAQSNTSYLSETNTLSRAGYNFFISSDSPDPPNNGSILTIAQITKTVIYSEEEAEMGALYINFK